MQGAVAAFEEARVVAELEVGVQRGVEERGGLGAVEFFGDGGGGGGDFVGGDADGGP